MWIPERDEDGLPIFTPTFENTNGLTTVWKGHLYTAQPGVLNMFDEEITSQIKLRGGWYEMMDNNSSIGDFVEFSIIDKNDVLGLFSVYGLTVGTDVLELKKFVRTEYINTILSGRQDFSSNGASDVLPGLFLRISYMSTGTNAVQFKVVEKYHEV